MATDDLDITSDWRIVRENLVQLHCVDVSWCHDLKEDLMGTKIFIIFVYLSNMLSTIGVKELRLCT